jgi:hypothetical protein
LVLELAPSGGSRRSPSGAALARGARPPAGPAPSVAREALYRMLPFRDGERRDPDGDSRPPAPERDFNGPRRSLGLPRVGEPSNDEDACLLLARARDVDLKLGFTYKGFAAFENQRKRPCHKELLGTGAPPSSLALLPPSSLTKRHRHPLVRHRHPLRSTLSATVIPCLRHRHPLLACVSAVLSHPGTRHRHPLLAYATATPGRRHRSEAAGPPGPE